LVEEGLLVAKGMVMVDHFYAELFVNSILRQRICSVFKAQDVGLGLIDPRRDQCAVMEVWYPVTSCCYAASQKYEDLNYTATKA
jgi:hypothetical protein